MNKNDHYRHLNERFDERSAELRRLGFKYEIVALDIAAFVLTRYSTLRYQIPAAKVLCADDIVWADALDSAKLAASS